jgi:hypothetical protein
MLEMGCERVKKNKWVAVKYFSGKFSKIHELVIITDPGAQMACRIFYL